MKNDSTYIFQTEQLLTICGFKYAFPLELMVIQIEVYPSSERILLLFLSFSF